MPQKSLPESIKVLAPTAAISAPRLALRPRKNEESFQVQPHSTGEPHGRTRMSK